MNARVWNLFHDGGITAIVGAVPGDLDFTVELYIRDEFDDPGKAFRIHLTHCTMLSFEPYRGTEIITDIGLISAANLEILGAEVKDGTLIGATPSGILRMKYLIESVFLDSGRAITLSDLGDAADRGMDKGKF